MQYIDEKFMEYALQAAIRSVNMRKGVGKIHSQMKIWDKFALITYEKLLDMYKED